MKFDELKEYLDHKVDQYNTTEFIINDPISIPHRFELKQDIEIAGFLTATISWGNRKAILQSANRMLNFMDNSPLDFVLNSTKKDLDKIKDLSIHRTFKGEDFVFFLENLKRIYLQNESLESLFLLKEGEENMYHAIERFRTEFLLNTEHRAKKHVSSTYKNSSAKRIMMFLRWMVRKDAKNVDFGIWENISPADLSIPLDVHTGNIARKLGMINRTSNDWKTVEELDQMVRKMNPKDPALYDFALFGVGVNKDF